MDNLTERLAAALRALAQTPIDGESINELLAREHEARRLAREALAAYDERVEAEAGPALTPEGEQAMAWFAAFVGPAVEAAAQAYSRPRAAPRPSVGRRVRKIGDSGLFFDGELGTLIDGVEDGRLLAQFGQGCICIGRPGIDFEFVD